MPVYRLIMLPGASAEPEATELRFENVADVLNFVERSEEFAQAEIWCDAELLCRVEASPGKGKVWTVNPPRPKKRS